MTNRPLVIVAICFAAGIILGLYLASPVVLAALALSILLSLIQLVRKKSFAGPLLLLFLAAGALACQLSLEASRGNIREYSGERGRLVGLVAGEPLWGEGEVVFPLKPETFEAGGRVKAVCGQIRVTLRFQQGEEIPPLFYGQQLSLQGTLYEPAGRRNPGGFDYRFFLERQGLAASFYGSLGDLKVLGLSPRASSWQGFVFSAREKIKDIFDTALPARESSLLQAIFLGERGAVEDGLALAFQRSGLAHMMAVSGLHIGLLAALLWGLWRRFFRESWGTFVFMLGLVFLYVEVTGMRPASLRAFFMLAMSMAALQLNRQKDLPIALALAALATLIYQPLLLFDLGFQLSYVATISIIVLAGPLSQRLAILPPYLKELVAVSLAAQLGTLPLTAYYFNQLSLIALLGNLFILPVMPFVVGFALAGAILGFLWLPLGMPACLGAYPLLYYMERAVIFLSTIPGAYLELEPGISHLLLAYGIPLIIYGIWALRRSKKGSGEEPRIGSTPLSARKLVYAACIFFILIACTLFYTAQTGERQLEVVFLDVGQGDAIFIETPDGYSALIDGGGRPPYRGNMEWTGDSVILPYLRWRGTDQIDAVIISHPHEDHFGGLFPVLREKKVALLLISPDAGDSPNYRRLLALAEEKGIARVAVKKGDSFSLGKEVLFTVYSPGEKLFSGTSSDVNNNSLVIKMTYGQISFLFTGDIEEEAMTALLKSEHKLKSDVLKMPHHGGYFTSADRFLQAVSPRLGVICVGSNNFGHPNPQILQSLERHGIEIYRTDYHGAVTVKTDGSTLWADPFLQLERARAE